MQCLCCSDDVSLVSDCYFQVKTYDDETVYLCESCFFDNSPIMVGMTIRNHKISNIKLVNL